MPKLVFELDSAQNELKEGSSTNSSLAVSPQQRLKKLLPCLERIFIGAGSSFAECRLESLSTPRGVAELREAGAKATRWFGDGCASQSRDWSAVLARLRRVLATILARSKLVGGWSLLGKLRQSERWPVRWGLGSEQWL